MIETFPMIDWTVSALWIQQCSLSEAVSGVVLAVSAARACCSAGVGGGPARPRPAQRLPSRGAGRPPTGHSGPGAGPGFAISELQRLQKKETPPSEAGVGKEGVSHILATTRFDLETHDLAIGRPGPPSPPSGGSAAGREGVGKGGSREGRGSP